MEPFTVTYYASLLVLGLALLSMVLGSVFNLIRGMQKRSPYGFAVLQLGGGLLTAAGSVYLLFFPHLVRVDDATAFELHLHSSILAFVLGLFLFAMGYLIDSARNLNASAREVEPADD